MINYTPTPNYYKDYICHYNHNHDPKNGQFAKNPGGSGAINGNQKKLKRNQRIDKWVNDDGSLTPKGEKTFRKLIDLDNQYEKDRKNLKKASDDLIKYFDDNYKGPKLASYKEMERQLYKSDKKYKKMTDDRDALWEKANKSGSEQTKELLKVARKDADIFYTIGLDRAKEILKKHRR